MAKMSSKQRNKLDDSEFGLPEKRMYPLNDKAHVESAVKLFGHCPDEDKPELARRILVKAKEFGMDSSGWTQVNTWAAKGKDYKKNNKKGDIKKESYIYTPERWTYNPTVYSEFYQEAADGEQSGFSKFLEGIKKMWIKFIESLINLWSRITDFFHGIKVKKLLEKVRNDPEKYITFKYRIDTKSAAVSSLLFLNDISIFANDGIDKTSIGMLIKLVGKIDNALKQDNIYDCMEYFTHQDFKEEIRRFMSVDAKRGTTERDMVSIDKDKLISFIEYVSEHSDLSAIRRMRYRVRKLKKAAEDKGYVGKDVKKFSRELRNTGSYLITCMQNYQSSMVFVYKNMLKPGGEADKQTKDDMLHEIRGHSDSTEDLLLLANRRSTPEDLRKKVKELEKTKASLDKRYEAMRSSENSNIAELVKLRDEYRACHESAQKISIEAQTKAHSGSPKKSETPNTEKTASPKKSAEKAETSDTKTGVDKKETGDVKRFSNDDMQRASDVIGRIEDLRKELRANLHPYAGSRIELKIPSDLDNELSGLIKRQTNLNADYSEMHGTDFTTAPSRGFAVHDFITLESNYKKLIYDVKKWVEKYEKSKSESEADAKKTSYKNPEKYESSTAKDIAKELVDIRKRLDEAKKMENGSDKKQRSINLIINNLRRIGEVYLPAAEGRIGKDISQEEYDKLKKFFDEVNKDAKAVEGVAYGGTALKKRIEEGIKYSEQNDSNPYFRARNLATDATQFLTITSRSKAGELKLAYKAVKKFLDGVDAIDHAPGGRSAVGAESLTKLENTFLEGFEKTVCPHIVLVALSEGRTPEEIKNHLNQPDPRFKKIVDECVERVREESDQEKKEE